MIALEIFLIIGKLCQLEKHKHMTYNFIKLLPFRRMRYFEYEDNLKEEILLKRAYLGGYYEYLYQKRT